MVYIFSWSNIYFSLYCCSIGWGLKKISFLKRTLTKGFFVKGDCLNISFNKSLWYDPLKRKFFKTIFFVWFDLEPIHPLLVFQFYHLFSFFCWRAKRLSWAISSYISFGLKLSRSILLTSHKLQLNLYLMHWRDAKPS